MTGCVHNTKGDLQSMPRLDPAAVQPVLTMLCLVGVGLLCRALRVIDDGGQRQLTSLVINVFVPVMLFMAGLQSDPASLLPRRGAGIRGRLGDSFPGVWHWRCGRLALAATRRADQRRSGRGRALQYRICRHSRLYGPVGTAGGDSRRRVRPGPHHPVADPGAHGVWSRERGELPGGVFSWVLSYGAWSWASW